MSLGSDDLGVLGNLGKALGLFDAEGNPDSDWLADPVASLKTMLANPAQRAALIAFVDEAMGGADRTTENGVVWLPVVQLDDPPLTVAITVDDRPGDGLHIGVGLRFATTGPDSATTLAIPLFRAHKQGGPTVSNALLLGSPGGRIRIGSRIVLDASAPVPGQARLGGIGLEADLPTSSGDANGPAFALALTGLQLPGADAPRDLRVAANGADQLDDAVLELALALVKAQADALGAQPALQALAGLLGLRDGDDVPDFPLAALPARGALAIADWVRGILAETGPRQDWLDHLAALLGGARAGDAVTLGLGAAALSLTLRVDSGPDGHPRLSPSLAVEMGDADARVEARADLFRIDLVSGAAIALPTLGLWAAAGRSGHRILDVTHQGVVARADALRIGFAMDASRRLNFVLAADGVRLGTHDYPTLDLTSPDAVMDAAGSTVEQFADALFAGLGDALGLVRRLLGLDPPSGVGAVSVSALVADPLPAIAGYWQQVLATPAAAIDVLGALRSAIGAADQAAAVVGGAGTAASPWRLPLAGPLQLQVSRQDALVDIGIAAITRVDDLGGGCAVIEGRLGARIARIDLAARSAQLLGSVEAALHARERGIDPPRARLDLGNGVHLDAERVGLRLGWSPQAGLVANVDAPALVLDTGSQQLPVTLPVIAGDGGVNLPVAGWDALETLAGHLGRMVGGRIGELAAAFGWAAPAAEARLRLADLMATPELALRDWLPKLALGPQGDTALGALAGLFADANGHGVLAGGGRPEDPYRFTPGDGLPEFALWFPPHGLAPVLSAIPAALRDWLPNQPGLGAEALQAALLAEAVVAGDVRELVEGRDITAGFAALAQRWQGGDGRIAPPPSPPTGVSVHRVPLGASQLLAELDLATLTGRTPATTVFVALGTDAWPEAPAGRRIDLTAAGLEPGMFAPLVAAGGDWFIALGTRADCLAGHDGDGTAQQAARLRQAVLDPLAQTLDDIAVVAVAGAGHAARLAAQDVAKVADLVTLGTPLSPISLTALSIQPTADALRLLQRLLPEAGSDNDALALGRALVRALMDLSAQADPGADLRPPAVAPSAPRAGLGVHAVFGEVSVELAAQAVTAIVAGGLAARAAARSAPVPPTGVQAGIRWQLPAGVDGTVAIRADARMQLFAYDRNDGVSLARHLHARVRIGDAMGWLTANAQMELRAVSVELDLPLDGVSPGNTRLVLHDARVFGQSWEALVLGNGADAMPVLPEARALLAAAAQRLYADTASAASLALSQLLNALGLTAADGSVVGDAIDQLVHDPAGLVRQRLVSAGAQIASALNSLLGASGAGIDLPARSVRVQGGSDASGRFGWHADVGASPAGLQGQLRLGADVAPAGIGGLQLQLQLDPLRLELHWRQPGGGDRVAALWPAPDGAALARMFAQAVPGLAAHAALETMRQADAGARAAIDAVLDALGLLAGAASDAQRALRPLAGLLADPAGWLRGPAALGANPARIQSMLDALRPLLGASGGDGAALQLTDGVRVAVAADGDGARLSLQVDPGAWSAPSGVDARLAAGVDASLRLALSGPPQVALETHLGLDAAATGRQAVHLRLGDSGIEVFLRPATGADIALLPFAGLGSLSGAAEAALPFLLDRLGDIAGTPGELVRAVGDALNLRSNNHFDATALRNWAADPVGALGTAIPTLTTTGLNAIAPLLDDFLQAHGITASAAAGELSVDVGAVTLSWHPGDGRVRVATDGIAVPGIHTLGGALAVSAAGLDELSLAMGPAQIDAGGVLLRPFLRFGAGNAPAGGRQVLAGLSADETHHFAARWSLDNGQFQLVAADGALAATIPTPDPAQVALRVVEVLADLVAAMAMAQAPVQALLDTAVSSGKDVRFLLRGVVLDDVPDPRGLIDGLFDPAPWIARLRKLFDNLAAAGIGFDIDGLHVAFAKDGAGTIGLQAGLTDRFALVEGDVSLWLENDARWIDPAPSGGPDGGVFVGFVPSGMPLRFAPSLVVNGVGLRIGKSSGPLLDAGITLESIALHVFAELLANGDKGGGVQLQFSNLAVSPGGAQGENGIASGILRDTGPTPPKPAFSPALAIQKHAGRDVSVALSAGEGSGPWWIAIQRGFGPLYLEQVGFGATSVQGKLQRVSLLMDGSVSMFGLTCAVDDLQITYLAGNNDFFNPASWQADLAGLAVSADMAGVSLAGGLLKQQTPQGIEYLGMLLGRFGVYGLTVYGGYGEGTQGTERFVSFFAIGAVNGPIGGPPAFFLTGIGGGFGINRKLVIPGELGNFADYPLIQALDIAATPSDPMTQLRELGQYFPMQKGTFWFAAGLSFNSFALVDGIAVVGVQIGDGLDINLLGLARMALPRPQAALVSIELALLVRFSSSEGVLWVQGQLTDNSWLLYPDIKLTGGFAYVIWFKGEKAGEFVLTLGGYHPDFHRDGYPVVPRLGLRWSIGSSIVIKAGSYFALTSEALMAGGDFEASAHFGPAWAEVKFGAHGIVFFDPFHYDVSAYARISAGVTIDTWLFGEITISVSLGARIHVLGPDFRGSATFEVGPIELTFEFGGDAREQKQWLGAGAFVDKFLEGEGGHARPHALMVNTGALPAKGEKSTPDGSAARPFVVVAEFSMSFTSTVPATDVSRAQGGNSHHAPSHALGVAPMNQPIGASTIGLAWYGEDNVERPYPFTDRARPFGHFPVGVWGPAQDPNARKLPKGEMIEALNELDLACTATPSPPGPEIPYYQVEIGKRKPLPFTRRNSDIAALRTLAQSVSGLVTAPATADQAFATAKSWLQGHATPTAMAALRGERQSPPRLGTLTEGLESLTETVAPAVAEPPPKKVYDHFVDAPKLVGLLSGATQGLSTSSARRTTVKDAHDRHANTGTQWFTTPPTLASVEAERSRSIAARLVLVDNPAMPARGGAQRLRRDGGTLIAASAVPPSAMAHAPTALVARRGAAAPEPLAEFDAALAAGKRKLSATSRAAASASNGATLAAGQIAVMALPNARRDVGNAVRPRLAVAGAPVRVVMLSNGGRRIADGVVGPGQASAWIEAPPGTERIVAIGLGDAVDAAASGRGNGLAGWHAGLRMPYAGWSTAIGPGCVVHSLGERIASHRERLNAGWIGGAELARGVSTVTTSFSATPRCVLVILDDPAAAGDPVAARQLLMGLDGAARARDAGGERAPVLLSMDNRSVLAYDIVADGEAPVTVSIASDADWSLVGVMASDEVDAAGAIALVSARGLDAALLPLLPAGAGTPSRLGWSGPIRSAGERSVARARAQGRPSETPREPKTPARAPRKPSTRKGGRR